MSTVLLRYSDDSQQEFVSAVPAMIRVWIPHDWLRSELGYDMRETDLPGCPEVYRFGHANNHRNFERSIFTEAWQWFAIDVLAMWRYRKLYKDLSRDERDHILRTFNGLYGDHLFLTNKAGVITRNNYPDGEVNRGDDPRIDPFVTGGNTLAGTIVGNAVKLYAFREKDTPPPVTYELVAYDPRICWATNIKRVTVDNSPLANASGLSYKVHRFSQYQDGTEVPYPFIIHDDSNGWNPLSDLWQYGWSEKKRPLYNPPELEEA